jgi:hypothetical protein
MNGLLTRGSQFGFDRRQSFETPFERRALFRNFHDSAAALVEFSRREFLLLLQTAARLQVGVPFGRELRHFHIATCFA